MSIIDDVRAEGVSLSPSAETIVMSAGVRTGEDLYSLLAAFPSLAINSGIPSARITALLTPTFSAVFA